MYSAQSSVKQVFSYKSENLCQTTLPPCPWIVESLNVLFCLSVLLFMFFFPLVTIGSLVFYMFGLSVHFVASLVFINLPYFQKYLNIFLDKSLAHCYWTSDFSLACGHGTILTAQNDKTNKLFFSNKALIHILRSPLLNLLFLNKSRFTWKEMIHVSEFLFLFFFLTQGAHSPCPTVFCVLCDICTHFSQ